MCESVFLNFAYPPFKLNAFRTTGPRALIFIFKYIYKLIIIYLQGMDISSQQSGDWIDIVVTQLWFQDF